MVGSSDQSLPDPTRTYASDRGTATGPTTRARNTVNNPLTTKEESLCAGAAGAGCGIRLAR